MALGRRPVDTACDPANEEGWREGNVWVRVTSVAAGYCQGQDTHSSRGNPATSPRPATRPLALREPHNSSDAPAFHFHSVSTVPTCMIASLYRVVIFFSLPCNGFSKQMFGYCLGTEKKEPKRFKLWILNYARTTVVFTDHAPIFSLVKR